MGHLVGNNGTDTCQILFPVSIYIIVGCLKNTSGKGHGIIKLIVISIHHRCRQIHLWGNRCKLLSRHLCTGQFSGLGKVAKEVCGIYIQTVQAIIPFIRISHEKSHIIQLFNGSLPGFFAHPVQRIYPFFIIVNKALNHTFHVSFSLSGKIAFYVELIHIVPQYGIHLFGGQFLRCADILCRTGDNRIEFIIGIHYILA